MIAYADDLGTPFKIDTWQREYRCSGGGCSGNNIRLSLASPSKANNPTIVVTGIAVGKTLTLYSDQNCTTSRGTATTGSNSVTINPDLGTTEGRYDFYFRVSDVNSRCSKSFLSYHFDLTPPGRPVIALVTTSGGDDTPTVRVSSVTPGDSVEVYLTATKCRAQTSSMGSAVVVNQSVDINVSALPRSGDYIFYARATDPVGNFSWCSGYSATYTYTSGGLF